MIIKRSKTYLKTKPKNAQLDSKFNEIKKNYERKSRGGEEKGSFFNSSASRKPAR